MEDELREVLRRRASRPRVPGDMPPLILRRARRRMGITGMLSVMALLGVGSAAALSFQALQFTPIEGTGNEQCAPIDQTAPGGMNNPILGEPMANAQEAEKHLAFTPLEPRGLGDPWRIEVQVGNSDIRRRPIAFLYDHPEYCRVFVIEMLPEMSPAEHAASIARVPAMHDECCRGVPGSGHGEMVQIRGGISALLSEVDDRSQGTLEWVEGTLVMVVRGPQLQRDELIAIANAL